MNQGLKLIAVNGAADLIPHTEGILVSTEKLYDGFRIRINLNVTFRLSDVLSRRITDTINLKIDWRVIDRQNHVDIKNVSKNNTANRLWSALKERFTNEEMHEWLKVFYRKAFELIKSLNGFRQEVKTYYLIRI